jgi:soluble lytic murein transglycosylase-like protein
VTAASAQTTAEYLKLRAQQHIVQPTSGQKLDQIIGPSIVEVQGIVQGSFRVGNSTTLMVKRDDNETLVVQCPSDPPDWLSNGVVPARLLVRVDRAGKYDPLDATLISVAPEADLANIDAAYWRVEAAKAEQKKVAVRQRRDYASASRGAGNGMYGWIGRSHRTSRYIPSSDSILAAYRNFILERNRNLSLQVADEIAQSVIKYSVSYGVDARLVMALIIAESDFHPFSTSHSGAMGLGQLMPGTASWMGVRNPYDLRDNLYGTIKLLRTHMDQYHVDSYPKGSNEYYQALMIVLAAYNAGEGAVRRHGGVPPYRETQAYVRKVIATYQSLTRAD